MSKSEYGRLTAQRVTSGPRHHFFGYYDKCPWDASGRYLLALEVSFINRPPDPEDIATIGIADLESGSRFEPIAETRAWNWQQGTMLQWLPTAPETTIIFNDRREGRFVAVILDIRTGTERTLPRPIYALSRDGRSAITLNFARVQQTRPGYGYAGVLDPGEGDLHPADDGIYWMDLATGDSKLIVSLAEIASYRSDETTELGKHWFNHLQFSTDDSRFLFLHRWKRPDDGRFTRMFTANPDGSDVYCVSDHEMVSHFDWHDGCHILAWARRHGIGDRYFLFTDQTGDIEVVGEDILTEDGHCSYSPDRRWILTDTYPDADSMRNLLLYNAADRRCINLGRFFSPAQTTGEIRCDLHPRWNHAGTQVCFDSVHEGERQMYVVDVSEIVSG